MDGSASDGQCSTMEVDAEMVTMDTNEEDNEDMTEGEGTLITQSDHHKEDEEELPVVPEPLGMVSQPQDSEVLEQCWRLPEGTCKKRVQVKGQGLRGPSAGSTCVVTLHMTEDIDLDLSLLGYPLGQCSIELGEGATPVSCLVDCALMSMKRGEMAEVCLHGLRSVDREISFQITLHDFTPATPQWRLTPTEKCASAAKHKEKGAQHFKDGNVYAAFAQFRTAVRLLLSVLPHSFLDDEATEKSYQQLLCQCYLNLAACQMKTGHHRHVITNCTHALKTDPSNVKALYRRASANASLENYSQAKEDLKLGLRVEPNNRALQDLMRTVSVKGAQSPSAESGLVGLSKMFT